MWSALWGLIVKLMGLIAAKPGPSPEAQAEGRAAAAQTQLKTQETADAEVDRAVVAARAVARADVADAARLRDGSDPDCRDCSA